MKISSFATMKGGTGKTTCCYQLAACIARTSKVLVIDFDAQCNLSSNFRFDIFSESDEIKTVANIFEDFDTNPLDILVPGPIKELPNLDLFPSTMFLYGTELQLSTRSYREQIMRNYINKNYDFFSYYDYILFDTGPNMGIINQNAFFASDHIILVCDPDCNSAKGAHVFLKLWDYAREFSGIENHVDTLIINNVERTKMAAKLNEYITSHPYLSKIVLNSHIIHTTRFKECVDQNKPIYYLSTSTKDAQISKQKAVSSIDTLMQELIERGIF